MAAEMSSKKVSGVSVIITCQEEEAGTDLTTDEYDQLVKVVVRSVGNIFSSHLVLLVLQMTKFTEFEIVTLWNHFKADFPSGLINKSHLSQMIKKTFPRYEKEDKIVMWPYIY